ncbi:Plasmid stabilization system family protein [Crenothrix polyspora]|uniref:Toxin n=1 Tax=Crenothrix polyspora TaxID=360316 RepID=A0A1R4H539_9GAMM|nr:type II toxin-antitoxin system RelE/ParE family toxin [Crenothrix polyspora]SJM91329.1 Plasmid stabilization system family protein [Crenothrix polyspora]
MKVFELSHAAKNDLRLIAIFTEKRWGKIQRNLYIKQLDDTFHLLGETPGLGVECNHIRNGYRKFPQGSHIIFYKQGIESKILIVRILHKSIDYNSN